MTQKDAKQILWKLAQQSPDFETLSGEYLPLLAPDAELPNTFPVQVVNALRSDPEMDHAIDRAELAVNTGEQAELTRFFGIMDLATPEIVIAVLVLLGAHFKLERSEDGKWSFRAGYNPLDAEMLKPILDTLATVLGKTGEGLSKLSKTLSGQEEEKTDG